MTTITVFYAGILGLLMAGLSIRVPLRRAALNAPWGDGDDSVLATRIRVFGNFIEYVPFIILLMALVEISNGAPLAIHVAGSVLIAARILHAVSLHRDDVALWRKILRGLGAMATWLILVSLAIYALALSIPK